MAERTVVDDLQRFIDEQIAADPTFADVLADEEAVHAVLDRLLALRRTLGVSQKEMARRLGIKQPSVSEFESEGSNPELRTVQRYARALGYELVLTLWPRTSTEGTDNGAS